METALLSLGNWSHARYGSRTWHIRRPDYEQRKGDLTLQIWGQEGYWHIVDGETETLLSAVSEPRTISGLLKEHRDWKRPLLVRTLRSVCEGLSYTSTSDPLRIENVSINLTTACNLSCGTCYVPSQDRRARKLDSAATIGFLENLRGRFSPDATISLLGGEPFLHPEAVLELARWAQTNGYTCNVSTNGTIPLDRIMPEIHRLGLQVQVSIDGASARTSDALRGPGTFDRAVTTAKGLIAGGVRTTLCMVACRENQREIGSYLRLAKALGAAEARVIPLKKIGNAANGTPAPALHRDIVQAVAAEVARDPTLEQYCQSDLYGILRKMVKEKSRRASCGSGVQTLLVQADGTVYPCINITSAQARLGGVGDPVETVLLNGSQWSRTLSVDEPQHPCYACAVKRWCLAGCPGETMQITGSLNTPHWNCSDLRNAIVFMMWRTGERTAAEGGNRISHEQL